jgi:glucokinase
VAGVFGQQTIGVDIGGTKVAAAAVDLESGAIALRQEIETGADRGGVVVADDIATLVEAVAAELEREGQGIKAIGIGIPELVDAQGQIRSTYLLDWPALPLAQRLYGLAPVRFESDVRAAALAEAALGAGHGLASFVYVSIGTGISSTLVQHDVPLVGARGGALVLSTAPLSVPCDTCGAWSEFVLEDYASGRALARRYGEMSGREVASAQEVVLAAVRGDRDALAVVDTAAVALGSAIGWLINVLDPEAVVIGGGLGLAGGLYWDCLNQTTRAHIWNTSARDLPIVPAALGLDAGLIGAALATRKSQIPVITTTQQTTWMKGGTAN